MLKGGCGCWVVRGCEVGVDLVKSHESCGVDTVVGEEGKVEHGGVRFQRPCRGVVG